ncbi:MAG: hypothetical protein QXN87_03770 [Candidatus Bathyarchaeia archaeon]
MRSAVFNIADKVMIGVKTEKTFYSRVIKRLMAEYGFFEARGDFQEADTLVTIGPIKSLSNNYVRLDGKYFVGDYWIQAFDSYKIAKWTVYIEGLGLNNIKMRIEPNFFACDLIPPALVTPLIGFILCYNGLSLVHAAGISNKDKAILLVGFGGSGKTSLVLKALESGLKLLGDDHVILDKGRVLPFPTAISLFKYNVPKGSVWAKRWKMELELKSWIKKLTLGYIYPVTKAKISDYDWIAEDSKLEKVILIEPWVGENCIIQEVEKNELIDSWIQNILIDSIYFYKYLCAFSYVNQIFSDYLNDFKETLSANLTGCKEFVKVIFPQNNIKRLFDTIYGLLKND